MSTIIARGGLWVVLLLALGCASALQEPPPVAELGDGGNRPGGAVGTPTEILAEADHAFALRPDPAQVARARSLFLEAAAVGEAPVGAYLGASRAIAWLVEHEPDGERRKELAIEGVQVGQWCGRLFPEVVECGYRLALAVGQQARERSSTAVDGLDVMVELLEGVIDADPELDFAGGHRVLAVLLLRAPGWPTGPGDPEIALEHARAAVEIAPDYPPNQLVLAEALAENGDQEAAVEVFQRGIDLAKTGNGGPEAADWLARAEKALADLL
ncbi:MAG: hypothetical protein V2I67_12650 [Thermoanaerobaculales bacterium]|nr:hypothetical protein [Thermoanaerobaculales bacterium]